MFVRWKRRKRTAVKADTWRQRARIERAQQEGDSLDAVIVENRRDAQKVRQRVVCYLGSIHELAATELRDRVLLWRHASQKLDGLNLKRPARNLIETKLSAKIEYVGRREIEQYEEAAWRRIGTIQKQAA